MSDSIAGPPPGGVVWDLDTAPVGAPIPRRVMRARREAAEALDLASTSSAPTWSVAPEPAYGPPPVYGAAVPLDDELV